MSCVGAAEGLADAQEISVKWNGYSGNLLGAVAALGAAGDALADVTLVAGGSSFLAHRLVLSANSALFRTIFEQTPARDAVVVLHDVPPECVRALLGFMYRGEVRVTEELLPRLLRAADTLRVCGLSAAAARAECNTADPHHDRRKPKNQSPPLAKKRKKECDEVSKCVKKAKEAQPTWDQVILHNSSAVPKLEPPECGGCDSACDSDGEQSLHHRAGPAPGDDTASLIEKEIENVLQSGAIVESIGATVENSITGATENDAGGGGAGYSNPSFPCPFCPRVYNSWGYRRRHVKSRHHTDRLSCKWCACELSSTGAWYGHATRAHGSAHAAARDSLVVLVEAHAVLTLHDPSPAALLRQLEPITTLHPPASPAQ